MDRWACVDVPELPIQIVLRGRPELRERPLALVEKDATQARVLLVSRAARRAGVVPGMRAPAACALCPGLEVAVVEAHECSAAVTELTERLRAFSPRLEPLPLPGTFLLDPSGLERLFGDAAAWAARLLGTLDEAGFYARIAFGESRMAAFALARGARGRTVRLAPDEERTCVEALPLRVLGLPRDDARLLEQLGITTVGAFVALPSGGLSRRFGESSARLRRALLGDDCTPLQPDRPVLPFEVLVEVEPPDDDAARLLFLARQALVPLLGRLASSGKALAALHLTLRPGEERILQPAAPGLDDRLLSDLIRLHLEGRRLAQPAGGLVLRADAVPATPEQLEFFAARSQRDAEAASRAVARVRAAYGPDSVLRACLVEAHLPEEAFRLEPVAQVVPPVCRPSEPTPPPTVVRAVLPRPRPTSRARGGPPPPPMRSLSGPYTIRSGWWAQPVSRDYHFAMTPAGAIVWLYFDRDRDAWFCHGTI